LSVAVPPPFPSRSPFSLSGENHAEETFTCFLPPFPFCRMTPPSISTCFLVEKRRTCAPPWPPPFFFFPPFCWSLFPPPSPYLCERREDDEFFFPSPSFHLFILRTYVNSTPSPLSFISHPPCLSCGHGWYGLHPPLHPPFSFFLSPLTIFFFFSSYKSVPMGSRGYGVKQGHRFSFRIRFPFPFPLPFFFLFFLPFFSFPLPRT